jgi:hypothetical protein
MWMARTTFVLVPGLVVCAVWATLVNHYYVRTPSITAAMVQQARESPPDSVLRELKEFRLLRAGPMDRDELVRAAEKLLNGIVDLPEYPAARIGVPFDRRDLDHTEPAWRLPLAGLVAPGVLLDAYDATDREPFFLAAQKTILQWGAYERRAWLPRGAMWNDHAVAARIAVLTELWRVYRHHPSYQADVGREILEQLGRTAALLAKPGHFTFATNHGIMQNVALLHVSLAFPMLPEVERYKVLALTRLRDQMAFYIDDEGVVLEHSAEYQRFGVELLGMTCRALTLLQQPVPDDWRRKYERAVQVYAALRRPDGSLPTFGDTDGGRDEAGPLVTVFDDQGRCERLRHRVRWVPARPLSVYPVAGNAIWWDGLERWPSQRALRQTVVTWSYFPGHAHKSADEMSVLAWGGGQLWWTNVGYWPYAMAGRSDAESWQNSNAPHLVNEDPKSARNTRLLSLGWSRRLGMVDVERSGTGDYVARRQVVHMRPDVWLIVDRVSGGDTLETSTTWTTAPDVTLRRGPVPGSYVLNAPHSPIQLKKFVVGSPGPRISQLEGSWSPFAGWQVVAGVPRPAPAIVIEQPARDSWSIAVWSLENQVNSARSLVRVVGRWYPPQDWTVELGMRCGTLAVERSGTRITIRDVRRRLAIETLDLTPAPEVTHELAPLRASFERAARSYPRFQDLGRRRRIVTQLLLVIFVGQEVIFWFIRRNHARYYRPLRIVNLIGWIAVGSWLTFVVLRG